LEIWVKISIGAYENFLSSKNPIKDGSYSIWNLSLVSKRLHDANICSLKSLIIDPLVAYTKAIGSQIRSQKEAKKSIQHLIFFRCYNMNPVFDKKVLKQKATLLDMTNTFFRGFSDRGVYNELLVKALFYHPHSCPIGDETLPKRVSEHLLTCDLHSSWVYDWLDAPFRTNPVKCKNMICGKPCGWCDRCKDPNKYDGYVGSQSYLLTVWRHLGLRCANQQYVESLQYCMLESPTSAAAVIALLLIQEKIFTKLVNSSSTSGNQRMLTDLEDKERPFRCDQKFKLWEKDRQFCANETILMYLTFLISE
jgi:hypothetical protein